MKLKNLLMAALRSLGKNKMRTFLTMLGIIIGVASVIAMLAIGEGPKQSIQAQISTLEDARDAADALIMSALGEASVGRYRGDVAVKKCGNEAAADRFVAGHGDIGGLEGGVGGLEKGAETFGLDDA